MVQYNSYCVHMTDIRDYLSYVSLYECNVYLFYNHFFVSAILYFMLTRHVTIVKTSEGCFLFFLFCLFKVWHEKVLALNGRCLQLTLVKVFPRFKQLHDVHQNKIDFNFQGVYRC